MSDKDWKELLEKLEEEGRTKRFIFGEAEREYVASRGMDILKLHATDFIRKRIAPATPKNDGRQTPAKGHPVFIAQHATGCNDRTSLQTFFGIEMGRELTEDEIEMIVDVILRWIQMNLDAEEA